MKKTIRTIIVMIITILFFVFLSPTVASLEIPNMEYNITQEDLNTTKEFISELKINNENTKMLITINNKTNFEDVQFMLNDIKISSKNEQLLNDLYLLIYFDGSPMYTTKVSEIKQPITNWISLSQHDIVFEFFFEEEIKNNYKDAIFTVNFTIKTESNVTNCPEINFLEYEINKENMFNTIEKFTHDLIFNNNETPSVSIRVKNTTLFQDIDFRVNELKIISEDKQLLNNLNLIIYLDNTPVYNGPFSKILFPTTNWIPSSDHIIKFEFFLPENLKSEYTDDIFTVNFDIETRYTESIHPEPEPIFPELKEHIINKDNINQEFTINYETMVAPYDVDLGFKIKNELEKDVELTFISLSYKEKDSENDFQNINREDFIFYFKNDFNLETIPANSELSDYIGFTLDLEKTYLLNLTFKATADIEEIIPPEDNSETITEIPSESQLEETIEKDLEQGSQIDEKVETSDNNGNNYKYLILILAGLPLICLALKKNKE